VLGLAWGDLDLDAGVANVSRASVYADGISMMLEPPKTEGSKGEHLLTPVVVDLLRRRRPVRNEQRLRAGDGWQEVVQGGRSVDLVFTTGHRWPAAAARRGQGRRVGSVGGGARSVGGGDTRGAVDRHHGAGRGGRSRPGRRRPPRRPQQPSSTAGYVRHLGRRPKATAEAARRLLDPTEVVVDGA
jgi:hypothetical protein